MEVLSFLASCLMYVFTILHSVTLLTLAFQLRDEEDPKELNSRQAEERAQLKREVYQKIQTKIFARCRDYAERGYVVRCADGHTRSGHPGIHVLSLDAQEAAACNCTKAANATYPCPKCLVSSAMLHRPTVTGTALAPVRTVADMEEVVKAARKAGLMTSEADKILREHGLHAVEVSDLFLHPNP